MSQHMSRPMEEPMTEPAVPKRMEYDARDYTGYKPSYSKYLGEVEPPKFTQSQMHMAQKERDSDQDIQYSQASKSGRKKSTMINVILKQKEENSYKDFQWNSKFKKASEPLRKPYDYKSTYQASERYY